MTDTCKSNWVRDMPEFRTVEGYLVDQLWAAKKRGDMPEILKLERVLIALDDVVGELTEEEMDDDE